MSNNLSLHLPAPRYPDTTGFTNQGDELMLRKFARRRQHFSISDDNNPSAISNRHVAGNSPMPAINSSDNDDQGIANQDQYYYSDQQHNTVGAPPRDDGNTPTAGDDAKPAFPVLPNQHGQSAKSNNRRQTPVFERRVGRYFQERSETVERQQMKPSYPPISSSHQQSRSERPLYYTNKDFLSRPDLDEKAAQHLEEEFMKEIQQDIAKKEAVLQARQVQLEKLRQRKKEREKIERRAGIPSSSRYASVSDDVFYEDEDYTADRSCFNSSFYSSKSNNTVVTTGTTTSKYRDDDEAYQKYIEENKERIHLQQIHRQYEQSRMQARRYQRELLERRIGTYFQRKKMYELAQSLPSRSLSANAIGESGRQSYTGLSRMSLSGSGTFFSRTSANQAREEEYNDLQLAELDRNAINQLDHFDETIKKKSQEQNHAVVHNEQSYSDPGDTPHWSPDKGKSRRRRNPLALYSI